MDPDLIKINKELRDKTPESIVSWAVSKSKRPIVTTNFGPYEAAVLYACTTQKPDISVIWCDSGYNTPDTYRHADDLRNQLHLRLCVYLPKRSAAHRNAIMDGIPEINEPMHAKFTEEVKLEPFGRAMAEHRPDLWFNNLRKGQTKFRDSLDIASRSKDGVLKVSPFFYWNDKDIEEYLRNNNLPNESNYFDPTKVLQHRECGLHTS